MSLRASVGQTLVSQLADCATWRALLGAASATAARTQIVLGDGGLGDGVSVDGDPIDAALPLATIRAGRLTAETIALGCHVYSGDATLDIFILPDATLSADDDRARLDALAAIVTELQEQIGTVLSDGNPAFLGGIFTAEGWQLEPDDTQDARWQLPITCAWSQLP